MKEITPDKFRCTLVECPAIFTTKCHLGHCPAIAKDGNNYIIIGKIVTVDDHPELAGRIGDGEAAVEIPAELIDEAVKSQIQP